MDACPMTCSRRYGRWRRSSRLKRFGCSDEKQLTAEDTEDHRVIRNFQLAAAVPTFPDDALHLRHANLRGPLCPLWLVPTIPTLPCAVCGFPPAGPWNASGFAA